MPDYRLESLRSAPVVGIDEAGCGPWAGPVVAGAVILYPDILPASFLSALDDSKKLSAKKRLNLYSHLLEFQGCGAVWATGYASVDEIDALNIRNSALLAMVRAVENLTVKPNFALVDGTASPALACPVTTVIKGDSLSLSIAAASIVAKVERDKTMNELAIQFPDYGWDRNAGYGTAKHIAALQQHGITCHHRKSFRPVDYYYQQQAS